jgi:glycosyltransferase involved in cell wall biosynthesis
MTKISIAIPAYNSEFCLRETLESALNQTHPAHEILVVDDGSTDRTEEVARSFGDRIRYIKQQNQGIAGARNTAIKEATGDWIAFLDHDDLILPTKLEKQLAIIEANPDLVVVYSAFTYLYTDGTTKLIPAFPSAKLWPALRYRTPILPSTSIIRRSALQEIGGFVQLYCVDDWNMWFRLIRRYSASAFKVHPEGLTMYRWWRNNISGNFMPVAEAVLGLLDTVLLQDLKGFKKAIWKRRIEARIYYSLAVSLREIQNERYWEFAIESLLKWPFCGTMITPHRYVVLAHMLATRIRSFSFSFRYWWPVRRCREDLTLSSECKLQ